MTDEKETKKEEKKESKSPSPNIKFIEKRLYLDKDTGKQELRLTEPQDIPRKRTNGSYVFNLPSGEEQLKGFYHKDAEKLIQIYGRKFKPIVNKGDK